MEVGLSIGLGRYSAVDVSDVLILGQAVEVTFYKRRRGLIVPMPNRTPLSRRQFQEIVELIAREGQIDLEVVSLDDDEEQMSTEEIIARLQEIDIMEPPECSIVQERINRKVHQVYRAEMKKQMDLLEATEG